MRFLKYLQDYRRGGVVRVADSKFAKLISACKDTQKPGKLVLTVTVKPKGFKQVDTVVDITIKAPEQDIPSATFFLTEKNELTLDDPEQTDIEDELAKQRAKSIAG